MIRGNVPGSPVRNGMPTGGGYVYRRAERARRAAARAAAAERGRQALERAAARAELDRQQLDDLEQMIHEDITQLREALSAPDPPEIELHLHPEPPEAA